MVESRIGLVTVTYNSADVVDGFMESALAQDFQGFKLYIIDNASKDGTLDRLRPYGNSRVVIEANPTNVGVAAGNNQGIDLALADGCTHVLLINNDTEFGPDLLTSMLEQMNLLEADMLVPKMMFYEPSNRIWCAGGGFKQSTAYSSIHFGEGEEDLGQFDIPKRVDYTPTCCMLIKRQVFERVGMMDEKFFVYYDDTDFCLRAMRAGIRLWYSPSSILYHKVSALTGGRESAFSIRYGTRNKVYFIRKHMSPLVSIAYLLAYYIFTCGKLIIGRDNLSMARIRQKAFVEGLQLQAG